MSGAGTKGLRDRGAEGWGARLAIAAALTLAANACADDWWNADWPYRVRIDCKAGPGDVAVVQVALADRTTTDGRDLRLIDADGQPRGFDILWHDPHLATLLRVQASPDEALTTWLYYGNRSAPRIETGNPHGDEYQQAYQTWTRQQTQRDAALKKRAQLERQIGELQKRVQDAERAGRSTPPLDEWRHQLKTLQDERDALTIPDALPEPKPGQPWSPQRGVLLKIYRKAKPGHPKTLRELHKMIGDAKLEGAGFRGGISDGFNPFGPSDEYISVYDAYLRIDAAGEYAFCTVSDDGSWVLINNHDVTSWPGAHGMDGGARGEKNGTIKLREGTAHIQYFQEEGTDGQMAFLGWKPPGAEQFGPIPPEQWLSVRRAGAGAYQVHGKPVLAVPRVEIDSTYWIRDSESKQVTLVRCADLGRSRDDDKKRREWSFGDGLTAEGREVTHVYFRLGRPEVTLTVTDAAGNRDAATCVPYIFQFDIVGAGRKYGKAEDYIAATADYDVERLARDDLFRYIEFCGNLEQWEPHVRAVQAYLRRFPDAADAPQAAAAAAESCLQPQAYDPNSADELLQRAAEATKPGVERQNLLLRRARVLSWNLDDPAAAAKLYDEVMEALPSVPSKESAKLRRTALVGQADVALLSGDGPRAKELYRQAEALAEKPTSQPEKLAKSGTYAYTVEDLLGRGEYKWARDTLDKWEDEFPLQKLEGLTFFLRGKVLFVEKPGELALRYLTLAERIAPRAVHVPEAVWLRANCLMTVGRYEEALAELRRITVDFTYTEFLDQAAEKMKECEAKLQEQKG
jgi:tetratricopeptide (TPR) repeat protein